MCHDHKRNELRVGQGGAANGRRKREYLDKPQRASGSEPGDQSSRHCIETGSSIHVQTRGMGMVHTNCWSLCLAGLVGA